MCKKVILDTNILYYWANVSSSNYDISKIQETISKYGTPFISELSLLEALVHFRNDKNSVRKLYTFLSDKHIGIIRYFKPEYSILTDELNELIQNDNIFNRICNSAFEKKLKFESEFLSWWLVNLIAIIGSYLYYKEPNLRDEKFYKFYRQFEALVYSIREADGFVVESLKNALEEFYKTEDEVTLKSSINSIYFTNFYTLLINYSCAINNSTISDLPTDSKKYSLENSQKILETLQSEELTKNLLKKMKEEEKIPTKRKGKALISEYNIDIEQAFDEYKEILCKDTNNYFVEYLRLIMNKYLLDKNKKINKNDIIDSQIFMQTNGYNFLTADSDFLKIIENVDKKKAAKIRSEIEKWKIIG